MTTIEDIIKDIRTDVPVRALNYKRIEGRVLKIHEVSYFFEIINVYRNVGEKSYLDTIKNSYMSSQKDTFRRYVIESIDHGVELCKKFAKHVKIEFTREDEQNLRGDRKNSDNLRLVIIERPIQLG